MSVIKIIVPGPQGPPGTSASQNLAQTLANGHDANGIGITNSATDGASSSLDTVGARNTAIAALSTVYQAASATLTSLAGLATTAYGRALLTLANAGAADWLVKASNLSDLANAATARTNLGVPAGSGNSTGTNTGDQTSVSGNAGTATALQTARNIDGQAFDGTVAITVIAPGTHAATSKTTPVDADEMPLVDSAASNVLKKLTWANLKATLKTYFDTLYAAISHTHAAADITSGTIAQARLGSGSGGAGTKVLYDDQTYKTPSAGGSVATDTIWDAKGDLAAGTGADTAAKVVVGANGKVLVADSAQTAGLKWDFPPGYEIGYDQITAGVNITSTTESAGTTVITASAYTFDGGPVMVEVFIPNAYTGNSGQQMTFSLFEGSTQIGRIGVIYNGGVAIAFIGRYRFTPSAASHTYKVTAHMTLGSGGTPSIAAGSGGTGAWVPAYIRFTKV